MERFVGKSEAHFIATLEEQLGLELGEGWDRKYARGLTDGPDGRKFPIFEVGARCVGQKSR